MAEQYEYRRFDLNRGSFPGGDEAPYNSSHVRQRQIVAHYLQPLGDEGWEIIYIANNNAKTLASWVEAQRPLSEASAHSSWEYAVFNLCGMPQPEWDNHIASCGWEKILDHWFRYDYNYNHHEWCVYKRPDMWRSTDDGDILCQLEALQANLGQIRNRIADHVLGPAGRTRGGAGDAPTITKELVRQILRTKWELSVETGHNVGTSTATQHWLAHQ